jgi:dTDP-4-dehydrorhamnose 3,5-epimerase
MAGVEATFVQQNVSVSRRFVLRGLHYQCPEPQGKLIRVLAGEIFDVVVDLRRSSADFGRGFSLHLTGADYRSLWVPPGFAHGFCRSPNTSAVLSDAVLGTLTTTHWHGTMPIWLSMATASRREPILSEKDRSWIFAVGRGNSVKVLITGAGGQLNCADRSSAQRYELCRDSPGSRYCGHCGRRSLCERLTPTLVMNAAAFTNVDAAEALPEAAARANAVGPAVLARTCRRSGAWLVHVSTDYVFGGRSTRPCSPTSLPQPLNVYGTTKLEEACGCDHECAAYHRSNWRLYAPHGQNFLSRMLEP